MGAKRAELATAPSAPQPKPRSLLASSVSHVHIRYPRLVQYAEGHTATFEIAQIAFSLSHRRFLPPWSFSLHSSVALVSFHRYHPHFLSPGPPLFPLPFVTLIALPLARLEVAALPPTTRLRTSFLSTRSPTHLLSPQTLSAYCSQVFSPLSSATTCI